MNKNKITAILIFAVLSAVLVLSGCKPQATSTADEMATPAQSSVSETSESATEETTVGKTTATTAAQATQAESDNASQTENKPALNTPATCTVNVSDKSYTCNKGDIINYVFNLKTPEALEDFQASTYYDSGMLRLIETEAEEMFPVAGNIVVYNTKLENTVKYNAVNLDGMDFTKGGVLISLKFEVLDTGGTAVSTTVEVMDSVKSEPYVSDFRIIGEIEYSEEIIK